MNISVPKFKSHEFKTVQKIVRLQFWIQARQFKTADFMEQLIFERLTLFLINVSIPQYHHDVILSFIFFHLKVSKELACCQNKTTSKICKYMSIFKLLHLSLQLSKHKELRVFYQVSYLGVTYLSKIYLLRWFLMLLWFVVFEFYYEIPHSTQFYHLLIQDFDLIKVKTFNRGIAFNLIIFW